MVTKKLSEIGRTTRTTQGFKDTDGTIMLTDSETIIHLTPAERREFAKELVDRWAWREDLGQTFDEFCKEQGI